MFGALLGFIGTVLGVVGSTAKTVIDATTTRFFIASKYGSAVMIAAMSHWVYWLAWGIAEVPLALWFGLGMLDTAFNGRLPDVAAIPPGLKDYAEIAWNNLFWSAGLGAGLTMVHRGVSLLERIFGK